MSQLVMCRHADCGELFDAPSDTPLQTIRCPACGRLQTPSASGATDEATKPAAPPENAPGPIALAAEESDASLAAEEPDESLADEPASTDAPLTSTETLPDAPPETPGIPDLDDLFAEEPSPPTASEDPAPEPAEDRPAPWSGRRLESTDQPPMSVRATSETAAEPAPSDAEPPSDASEREAPAETMDLAEEEVVGQAAFTDIDLLDGGEAPDRREEVGPAFMSMGVFGIGTIGLLAGALLGWLLGDRQAAWAYFGAMAGWMLGFVIAFLAFLAVHADQIGQVPCPGCGHRLASSAPECGYCGRRLHAADVYPLTIACYHALGGAVKRWPSALQLVAVGLLLMGAALSISAGWQAEPDMARRWWFAWTPGLLLIASLVASVWLRTLLSMGLPNGARSSSAPGLLTGLQAAGVILLCAAPIVTIPLLPLCLLRLTGLRGPGGLRHQAKQLTHCANDYALLWLWLMLYAAIASLGIVLCWAVSSLADLGLDVASGGIQALAWVLVGSLGGIVPLAILALFAMAMFRCMAAFGRQNSQTLRG